MKRIVFCLFFSPLIVTAQEKGGIQFEQNLTWEQIKAKAKAENKYIFVDCYSSWCAPCKHMDKDVYPDEKAGNYFKDKFICVKVQMDTTANDNQSIMKWYPTAASFQKDYNVMLFPTFLFFSPLGKVVHKAIGERTISDFIAIASSALDTSTQYYAIVQKYRMENLDYTLMPSLANTARQFKDDELAASVARDYIDNYILKLPRASILTKKNLDFIQLFIQSSKDKGFSFYYHNVGKIDSVMGDKDYAQYTIRRFLLKEDIFPWLWEDSKKEKMIAEKPDWVMIQSIVKKKYPEEYAEKAVIDAQISWYWNKKDWDKVGQYWIKNQEKYGLDTNKRSFNAGVWNIFFLRVKDLSQLHKVSEWMRALVSQNPTDAYLMDTYANMLYKTGKASSAIKYEEKVIEQDEKAEANGIKLSNSEYHKETLIRMKKGIPTWDKDYSVTN